MVTLGARSCVARQEPYIPGALSILKGTVPGRVRGSGHMVPTYFRRELRDRSLQRRLRLRTFVGFVSVHCFCCCALPVFAIAPPADPLAHERVENIWSPPALRGRSPSDVTC